MEITCHEMVFIGQISPQLIICYTIKIKEKMYDHVWGNLEFCTLFLDDNIMVANSPVPGNDIND